MKTITFELDKSFPDGSILYRIREDIEQSAQEILDSCNNQIEGGEK